MFFDLKYILLYGYFTPVLKTHAVINGILSKIAIRILELFSIGAMLFSRNSNVIGVLSPFFSMSSYYYPLIKHELHSSLLSVSSHR